jgi:hypothetical protein
VALAQKLKMTLLELRGGTSTNAIIEQPYQNIFLFFSAIELFILKFLNINLSKIEDNLIKIF